MRLLARHVSAPLLLLAMGLSAAVSAAQAIPGFMTVSPEGEAHFYFGAELPVGQDVFIQTPGKSGKAQCCTRLSLEDFKPVERGPDEVSNVADHPLSRYTLTRKLDGHWGKAGFMGIALSDTGAGAVATGPYGVRSADRQKGRGVRARLCYGQEGVNLISYERGKVRALYMSFGYTLDQRPKPHCSASDERDLGRVSD